MKTRKDYPNNSGSMRVKGRALLRGYLARWQDPRAQSVLPAGRQDPTKSQKLGPQSDANSGRPPESTLTVTGKLFNSQELISYHAAR